MTVQMIFMAMVLGLPAPQEVKEQPWLTVVCSAPKVKPIEQVIARYPVVQTPVTNYVPPRVLGGSLVPIGYPSYTPTYSMPSYMPSYAPACVSGNCVGNR